MKQKQWNFSTPAEFSGNQEVPKAATTWPMAAINADMGRKHFSPIPSRLTPSASYNKRAISQQPSLQRATLIPAITMRPVAMVTESNIDPSHHNETSSITTSCCSVAYRPPAPAAALQSLPPRAVRSSQRGPA